MLHLNCMTMNTLQVFQTSKKIKKQDQIWNNSVLKSSVWVGVSKYNLVIYF